MGCEGIPICITKFKIMFEKVLTQISISAIIYKLSQERTEGTKPWKAVSTSLTQFIPL
jgi:hypothetical protein